MTVQVFLDTNERALLAEATAVGKSFPVRRLPVGDIGFYSGDDLLALVERKTLSDLDASILDGRFREQRARLVDAASQVGGPHCFYIVEGCRCRQRYHSTGGAERVAGALENLVVKHRICVLFTTSMADTLNTIERLSSKLAAKGTRATVFGAQKLKTRGGVIKDHLFAHMLTVIPGVSMTVAQAIATHYPSWAALVAGWEGSASAENALADIPITGKRRVGPAVSRRVYDAYTHGSLEK